jgi:hypothetical protein
MLGVTLKGGCEDEGEELAERRFIQESGKGRVYELANKEYAFKMNTSSNNWYVATCGIRFCLKSRP